MRHINTLAAFLFSLLLASACAPMTVGRANGEMADYVDRYDDEGNLVGTEKRTVVKASAYGMNAMDQGANFGEADGRRRINVAYGNLYGMWYGQSPYLHPAVAAGLNGYPMPKRERGETSNPRLEAFRSGLIKDCVDGKRGSLAQCTEWVDCKLFGSNHGPDLGVKTAQANSPAPTAPGTASVPCQQPAATINPVATPPAQVVVESKELKAAWDKVNQEIAASADADDLSEAIGRIPNILASDDHSLNPALAQLAADLSAWISSWKSDLERAELAPLRIIVRRLAATHFQINEDFIGALTTLRAEAERNHADGQQSEKLRSLAGRVIASVDKVTGHEPEKKDEKKGGNGKGKRAENDTNKKGGAL